MRAEFRLKDFIRPVCQLKMNGQALRKLDAQHYED